MVFMARIENTFHSTVYIILYHGLKTMFNKKDMDGIVEGEAGGCKILKTGLLYYILT